MSSCLFDRASSSARLGQLHDVPAPVGGVALAGDEAALLELVEQADDVARVQAEGRPDRVLRHRAAVAQQLERDQVPRAEAAGHAGNGGAAADPGQVVDERQELLAPYDRLTCRCRLRHVAQDTVRGQ